MASFTPDPNNRGYFLPPGCKDLHDVLQLKKRKPDDTSRQRTAAAKGKQKFEAAQAAMQSFGAKLGEHTIGQWQLCELVPSLTTILESGATKFMLLLLSPEPDLEVKMSGGKATATSISLRAKIGTAQNKIAREFCQRHHLQLPKESGALPPQFLPGLPVHQIYRLDPPPPEATAAAGLVRAVFAEVAGLKEEESVNFFYIYDRDKRPAQD